MMDDPVPEPDPTEDYLKQPAGTEVMEATPQRTGDPEKGRNYLINGDYVDSGIPAFIYNFGSQGDGNLLERSGANEKVSFNFTAINAPNGQPLVVSNCLACHAQKLNGELIVGLGNTYEDHTVSASDKINAIDQVVLYLYKKDSPQWDAYEPFRRIGLAAGPRFVAPFRGPNPAIEMNQILASYRDPVTLAWHEDVQFTEDHDKLNSDVPPWWVLKKKNVLFYDGSGQGDFTKFNMATSMLTLTDTSKAMEIYKQLGDVLAFMKSVEAPVYPGEVDGELVAEGEQLFFKNCARCHGTYGEEETYPNLLVDVSVVGTDPLYTKASQEGSAFREWWNNGWFGKAERESWFAATNGYIAQPLDGIWASAPYLHNGSIPTLDALLNSSLRPTYWTRNYDHLKYDLERVGWEYTEEMEATNSQVYDTTVPGYGNYGHVYGDVFSDAEREALLEYLKTL